MVENRENKSIAYTAVEQLHPARKSAPRRGYHFERISSVTGRGQRGAQHVRDDSGQTKREGRAG